ncbi:MAG: hypothetical protein R3Y24_14245 [Eubacteriales bacterium]
MGNIIAVVLVMIVLGSAIMYIVREKKKGVTCIGCPAAGNCAHKCAGSTSVHEDCGCDDHK